MGTGTWNSWVNSDDLVILGQDQHAEFSMYLSIDAVFLLQLITRNGRCFARRTSARCCMSRIIRKG